MRVIIPNAATRSPTATPRAAAAVAPPSFDAALHRDRNVVERAFHRLKGWRPVATRCDRHARNYRAGVIFAWGVLF
jgi:transposase